MPTGLRKKDGRLWSLGGLAFFATDFLFWVCLEGGFFIAYSCV